MNSYYLAKTEPSSYSIDQLRSDLRTVWDGIRNPQAVRAVRAMKPGDRVFIYHSGGQSAVVGLATVAGPPRPDPKDAKSWVVDLEYLMHLDPPVTLREIKSTARFEDWALVKQGRLSTMAVPQEFVNWMRERYPGAGL